MANFTIDKIRRISQYANADVPASENHGVAIEKGDILWTIKDVTDFSISNSSESVDAVDGNGVVIESYLRSKSAEMSGSNALFDLPLAAAQAGTKMQEGSVDIEFHDISKTEISDSAVIAALAKTPKMGGEPTVVYVMNGDGSLGEKLTVGASANVTYADPVAEAAGVHWTQSEIDTAVAGDPAYGKTVDDWKTAPVAAQPARLIFAAASGVTTAGVQVFIPYTYEEADAQKFTNFADANTIPGRCVVEGLGKDVCSHELVYFYIVAPYAQLSLDGDLSFATDGSHDFTISCKKEYCGEEGLYSIIVC